MRRILERRASASVRDEPEADRRAAAGLGEIDRSRRPRPPESRGTRIRADVAPLPDRLKPIIVPAARRDPDLLSPAPASVRLPSARSSRQDRDAAPAAPPGPSAAKPARIANISSFRPPLVAHFMPARERGRLEPTRQKASDRRMDYREQPPPPHLCRAGQDALDARRVRSGRRMGRAAGDARRLRRDHPPPRRPLALGRRPALMLRGRPDRAARAVRDQRRCALRGDPALALGLGAGSATFRSARLRGRWLPLPEAPDIDSIAERWSKRLPLDAIGRRDPGSRNASRQ